MNDYIKNGPLEKYFSRLQSHILVTTFIFETATFQNIEFSNTVQILPKNNLLKIVIFVPRKQAMPLEN